MKIKKVEEKPMQIHIKERMKIHKEEKARPEVCDSKVKLMEKVKKKPVETPKKTRMLELKKEKKQKAKAVATFSKENGSVKVNNKSLHIAGVMTGRKAVESVEGGEEVANAASVAYVATEPVARISKSTADALRYNSHVIKQVKVKKVDIAKQIGKKEATKAVKYSAQKVAKDTSKKVAKETTKAVAKTTAKVAATTAATAAGTAISPGVGTAIGVAAGYAAGVKVDNADAKAAIRMRKIRFFIDKMQPQDKQKDNLFSLVKDVLFKKIMAVIAAIMPIIGMLLLPIILIVGLIAAIVMAIVAFIYNSPFAIFLPPLDNGETVNAVGSAYYNEFIRNAQAETDSHDGYDEGKLIYLGYDEDVDAYGNKVGYSNPPTNYKDILACYMVKHGVGDTASLMKDSSKKNLKKVVDDMCSYSVSYGSETIKRPDGTEETKKYKYVNITIKSYKEMIDVYKFNADQKEMLEKMMNEFSGMISYNKSYSGGGGDPNYTHMGDIYVCEACEMQVFI